MVHFMCSVFRRFRRLKCDIWAFNWLNYFSNSFITNKRWLIVNGYAWEFRSFFRSFIHFQGLLNKNDFSLFFFFTSTRHSSKEPQWKFLLVNEWIEELELYFIPFQFETYGLTKYFKRSCINWMNSRNVKSEKGPKVWENWRRKRSEHVNLFDSNKYANELLRFYIFIQHI